MKPLLYFFRMPFSDMKISCVGFRLQLSSMIELNACLGSLLRGLQFFRKCKNQNFFRDPNFSLWTSVPSVVHGFLGSPSETQDMV